MRPSVRVCAHGGLESQQRKYILYHSTNDSQSSLALWYPRVPLQWMYRAKFHMFSSRPPPTAHPLVCNGIFMQMQRLGLWKDVHPAQLPDFYHRLWQDGTCALSTTFVCGEVMKAFRRPPEEQVATGPARLFPLQIRFKTQMKRMQPTFTYLLLGDHSALKTLFWKYKPVCHMQLHYHQSAVFSERFRNVPWAVP